MALRRALSRSSSVFAQFRWYSSEKKYVDVAVNDKTGVAVVTLQRPPVNSLNLELITALRSAIEDLEAKKAKGLILTSSSNSVFSAGLDILEMYKPDDKRVKEFWTSLQDLWIKLYGSTIPTAAVVNGHSPAGGCLLAMSTEYRVMLNNFTIGLNETQLGIVAPSWFAATMRNTIGTRQTELALTTGRLFKTEEALKVGLIDDIAQDKNEGIAKAEEFIKRFARIPPMARAMSKNQTRGKDIQALQDNRELDLNVFLAVIKNPKVQKGLELYLASLKQK